LVYFQEVIMKRQVPAIFLFICIFYLPVFAQTTNDTSAVVKDTFIDSSYIKYYDHYLNFTAGWSTRNTRYIISYPQYYTRFVLSPKETDQFYFGLDYSLLYLYYSFTPKVFNLNKEDTIKGKSTRLTFGTGFSFKQWQINLDYQSIKGYYLHNTNEFIPGWTKGDAYIQFPGLRTIQAGGQVGYNFNEKFSISSLTSGKEQQLKTVITFFPILSYWHIKMKDETTDSVQKANNVLTVNNDVNLMLPVAMNIVFAKNFYVAAFAGPVIGVELYKANAYDENGNALTTSGTRISTGYYARGSIGYTGKNFFAGIDAVTRYYEHQQQSQKFSKNSYGIQVYLGTRFDPPGFLKKTVKWLEKINPL
jgi:hypothetical protein